MAVDTDLHVGIGTPVTAGVPTPLGLAEPLPRTLLSINRFAQVMGINPVHFMGATAGDSVFPVNNRCSNVWPRYPWQRGDAVSHWELAHAILEAERDLAEALGWWPAPRWVAQDVRQFPRPYRPEVYRAGGGDVRAQRVGVKLLWGKVISPGQRVVTPVATASVAGGSLAYTDEDGDGFAETATVSVGTTATDPREVKVYFSGAEGAEEWEIRPCRTKGIAGGVFTAVFDSWLFIDPERLGAYPTVTSGGFQAIDISTIAHYVTAVQVYREQNVFLDADYPSAVFLWEPQPRNLSAVACTCTGVGCAACQYTTQDGCLHVRDALLGIGVPQPANFDAATGQWNQVAYACGRDPDMVRAYYLCGHLGDRYLAGQTLDPLEWEWAKAIAYLATARLERPFCNCANLTTLAKQLREDLAAAQPGHVLPFSLLECRFGTRRGEIEAYRKVWQEREKVPSVALA